MRTLLKDSFGGRKGKKSVTFPTRPSSLGRRVFLGYASRTHGLNVSTKAGLSEVTHWSLLASNLRGSEGDVHNWLILSRRTEESLGLPGHYKIK